MFSGQTEQKEREDGVKDIISVQFLYSSSSSVLDVTVYVFFRQGGALINEQSATETREQQRRKH